MKLQMEKIRLNNQRRVLDREIYFPSEKQQMLYSQENLNENGQNVSVYTMENNLANKQIEQLKSYIIIVYILNYTGINK